MDRVKHGAVIEHGPGEIKVVGGEVVQRLVHATTRQPRAHSPAQEVLHRRARGEALDGDRLVWQVVGTEPLIGAVDVVATAVEEVCALVLANGPAENVDRIGCPEVVAEQDPHERCLGGPHGSVVGTAEQPSLIGHQPDPGVRECVAQQVPEVRLPVLVDHDQQSPVGAGLLEDTLDGLLKVWPMIVRDRQEDRDLVAIHWPPIMPVLPRLLSGDAAARCLVR